MYIIISILLILDPTTALDLAFNLQHFILEISEAITEILPKVRTLVRKPFSDSINLLISDDVYNNIIIYNIGTILFIL